MNAVLGGIGPKPTVSTGIYLPREATYWDIYEETRPKWEPPLKFFCLGKTSRNIEADET